MYIKIKFQKNNKHKSKQKNNRKIYITYISYFCIYYFLFVCHLLVLFHESNYEYENNLKNA